MGSGHKTFNAADVLTAADVNNYLMEQSVMSFADATARDAAVTSPEEGMVAYLQDSNSVTVYSGSAWVTIADLEVLTVDSANGRVGLATSAPQVQLDLAAPAGESDREAIRISADGGDGSTQGKVYMGLSSWNSGTYPHARIGVEETDLADYGASIVFQTRDTEADVAPTTKVTITEAGDVGIGTTPTEKLHVATASGAAYIKQENGTATTYLGPDSSDTGLFGTSTAHDVRFITSNTERMRIDTSGRVGIGTTPSFALDVNGQAVVGGGDDRTPNGSGDGHLMIEGNGYTGFASLDGSAMWVGQNSGSRDLILATDETARLTVTGAGDVKLNGSSNDFEVTVDGTNFYGLGKYYSINGGVNISSSTAWSDVVSITVPKGRWLSVASGRFEYSIGSAGRQFRWRLANKSTGAIYNSNVTYQTNHTSLLIPMAASDVITTGGSQVIVLQAQQSASGGSVAVYANLQVVGVH